MINVNKLNGAIAEAGYSKRTLAKKLGMNESTLSRKLKRGVLGSDEIENLISILNIKDPMLIFFNQAGT